MARQRQTSVAIVTGAGSGIGQVVSVLLGDAGYQVVLVGRDRAKLKATTARIIEQTTTSEPLILAVDVAQEDGARSVVEQAMQQWGRVDALVNNAAVLHSAPLDQTSEQSIQATFATNTFGPAYLISHLWPVFVKQKSGCIVNVSSMSSVDPFPGLGLYAASKAALESLTRSICGEGSRHNIRGFSVAPGAVETAMLRSILSKDALPDHRTLKPVDVARVIVECIQGKRESSMGKTIFLPSP